MKTDALRQADGVARERAQREFALPFLLEAGAGSGKTATLVARILAWCLGPGWEKAQDFLGQLSADPVAWGGRAKASGSAAGEAGGAHRASRARPPQATSGGGVAEIAARVLTRLAAITFTEAAAAEMADRVGKAFAAVERGQLPVGFARALLAASDEELACRARALVGELDRLNVSTIHAFCRRLLAAHPLEAGLPPAFEIDAEGDALDQVLQETLDEALPELYGRAGGSKVAEGAMTLATLGLGPREIAEAVRELVAIGVPPEALVQSPFTLEHATQVAAELAAAARAFGEAGGERLATVPKNSKRTHATLAAVLALETLAPPTAEDGAAALLALAEAVAERLAEADAERLELWARLELSQGEAKALGEQAAAVAEAANRLVAALAPLDALDPVRFEAARAVLGPLAHQVAERLRKRGFVTYQALLVEAAALLERHADLAAFVARGMDQLLVDEFQDTDAVQCALVARLAFGGKPEERPGLFVVGDPKQSIYGWRSADLAAYDRFVERLVEEGGVVERLSVSFRSAPPILAEVERLTAGLFVRKRGVQPEFTPLAPSLQRQEATGFDAQCRRPIEHWVVLAPPAGEDEAPPLSAQQALELEAAAIARDVADLHATAGVRWGEVALLLRATTDLDAFLRAFQEAGVPYVVARDRSYFRRREVLDAAALVRTVLDPLDALALATVLRAAWVGVPDAGLLRLWQRGLPGQVAGLTAPSPETLLRLETLSAEVAAEIAPLASEIPGLEAMVGWEHSLVAFLRVLAELRLGFYTLPADRFVDRLRTATLIEVTEAARFLGAFRVANLERFFRHLKETLDDGGDADAVLRFLRRSVAEARQAPEGRPAIDLADAVQVMTIHKAKGLEFAHVYVAQLGKQPNARGSAATAARQLPERSASAGDRPRPGAWELRLLGAPSPGWWRVEQHQRELAAAEQVRLLYVASTRAGERLVLSGAPAKPPRLAEESRSLGQLVALRQPPPPIEALAAGEGPLVDEHGVLWLVPEPVWDDEAESGEPIAVAPPPQWGDARESARALAAQVEAAQRRQARPFSAAASALAHERLEEALAGAGESGESRAIAKAVGTAVHRVLATFRFEAEAAAELAQRRAEAETWLARELAPEELATARERLHTLFERFLAGPLWPRFTALESGVIARELPVLLPPSSATGEEGPVGYVSGSVDLLYRDERGEWVVADYKTDEVAGETEIAARAQAYQPQLATYQRAVEEALGLPSPPRAELWFLALGRVVGV